MCLENNLLKTKVIVFDNENGIYNSSFLQNIHIRIQHRVYIKIKINMENLGCINALRRVVDSM